ncbi:molybdopterin biosynthesis MoaE protein [Gluconacetobacter diazotrophicus PA1 5]|uniref:Molybdopterin synthase catalytic subunit n=2 Tax=Gluconacetobacter diazotrophicus TaxID=33996 RepID=A9HIG3_GLUDA|nr:molybdenum cofactor biosynthesis protein MoaE [Gluconacetobacter diazotrophicus]ACI49852.1 molybdopterin biosynthesis MoaE protein [Gluconacetobacter diazotrophicus PA1 5]MBB2155821.1 molybdenum cofactor biosynthesis protein MoaE [Gluconacetobacter diazotrophicus]TWB10299.1 molybdopterin synthase catalytic subunit [Gluconacetobacter diazotrophicus]CAP55765.1 putative molybdopterin-converting factor subunit 2 [Gluconacetobacter diazotrophicus PA1 5]
MRVDVRVQADPFSLDVETARLTRDGHDIGGMGMFLGVVRGGDGLAALTLEHYPGMTESMIARIVHEAGARFGLLACTVIHRVGRLEVGAPIVLVLCAAAHRGAALEATSFVIDWLKTRAPFWKREDRADGSSAWVEARESDEAAATRWGPVG